MDSGYLRPFFDVPFTTTCYLSSTPTSSTPPSESFVSSQVKVSSPGVDPTVEGTCLYFSLTGWEGSTDLEMTKIVTFRIQDPWRGLDPFDPASSGVYLTLSHPVVSLYRFRTLACPPSHIFHVHFYLVVFHSYEGTFHSLHKVHRHRIFLWHYSVPFFGKTRKILKKTENFLKVKN